LNEGVVTYNRPKDKTERERQMPKFQTMTPDGMYGCSYEGATVEEAADVAEAAGENVVDITDHGGEWIIVTVGSD
jgi:hypothetical protein